MKVQQQGPVKEDFKFKKKIKIYQALPFFQPFSLNEDIKKLYREYQNFYENDLVNNEALKVYIIMSNHPVTEQTVIENVGCKYLE